MPALKSTPIRAAFFVNLHKPQEISGCVRQAAVTLNPLPEIGGRQTKGP